MQAIREKENIISATMRDAPLRSPNNDEDGNMSDRYTFEGYHPINGRWVHIRQDWDEEGNRRYWVDGILQDPPEPKPTHQGLSFKVDV